MPSFSLIKSVNAGGYGFSNSLVGQATSDSQYVLALPLPVGNTLTNWVKTDANTAAGDLAGGHGLTNGTYDFYWTVDGVVFCRSGVAVTITTNAVAADGGAGTDFPASATVGVVMTKQVVAACPIDGDNAVFVAVMYQNTSDTAAAASADFQDASNNSIELMLLTEVQNTATGLDKVLQQTAARAALTGALITQVKASNSSTTAAGTLIVVAGVDATP
jgi:hypothetical protein